MVSSRTLQRMQKWRNNSFRTMRQLTQRDQAARLIQRQWRAASCDSRRLICRTRLLAEFRELIQ
jgi:hypothetical protein